MGTLRALLRAAALLPHLMLFAALAALWPGQWAACPWRRIFLRSWARSVCRSLGLRIDVRGRPMQEPRLLAANHVSWLDILALWSVEPACFVAKEEVDAWPVVGWLASRAGTLFLKRGSSIAAACKVVQAACLLKRGVPVAVFPEGTSSLGASTRRFHAAFFEAALLAGVEVEAVALRYPRGRGLSLVVPFVGDDLFGPHLWRVLRQKGLRAELEFQGPVRAAERRSLAAAARERIDGVISGLPARCPGSSSAPASRARTASGPRARPAAAGPGSRGRPSAAPTP